MLHHFFAVGLVLLAALPVVMLSRNLPIFKPLPPAVDDPVTPAEPEDANQASPIVSVLIPARDEESSIEECLRHVLDCNSNKLEVIVMDDHSTDRTNEICQRIAASDRRLRVQTGQEILPGWNGKQYACWRLAQAARGRWLLFIDADVRLSANAIPRLVAAAESADVDLLSGFPKQLTRTWSEKLMIPLMHFILLGYLPLDRMRASPGPEFAAGCGQLFFARREAYMMCGGHKSIALSRHDGVKLPRAFRRQGFKTDIFDATDLASCRMYHNLKEVIRGLLKNATEGIGNWRTIVPFTLLLAGASVLPPLMLILGLLRGWSVPVQAELTVATILAFVPRIWTARHFGQSWLGAALHPLSVALFLLLQWLALLMEFVGYRVRWRGR